MGVMEFGRGREAPDLEWRGLGNEKLKSLWGSS